MTHLKNAAKNFSYQVLFNGGEGVNLVCFEVIREPRGYRMVDTEFLRKTKSVCSGPTFIVFSIIRTFLESGETHDTFLFYNTQTYPDVIALNLCSTDPDRLPFKIFVFLKN